MGNVRDVAPSAREGFVYFIEAVGLGRVKIGLAADVKKRCSQLQVASPTTLALLGVVGTDDVRRLEVDLHRRFSALRDRGEWFRLTKSLRATIADLTLDGRGCPFTIAYHRKGPMPATVDWLPGDTSKTFAERVWKIGHALSPETFVAAVVAGA